ncbi:uncharacterized protein IAS62_005834 [Cryptococcus decagattii]|uniref:Xylanolytic transcriptional activator regulatory domain-containing protein n=1 Tax=Cryptococcus decagattii TaxID=1859122 RepID=A0ABZ2B4T5_9TREE
MSSSVSAQSARSARPSASVRPASRTRDSAPPVEPKPSVPSRELGPRTSEEAGGDDALTTGVGLLSLAGSQEARFLGSSSGLTWARLVSATLIREGVLPPLHSTSFSDPPIPFTTAPEAFAPPPPLPSVHLRLYYLDVAYKHIQARYACLDWLRIRRWHEQADSICGPVNGGWGNGANHDSRMAAFFLWLVYGYGARMTEDINLPGAVSHEIYYNAAISCLPTITLERSLLSVQAQLFLTLYTYRHPTSELSLWRLGGAAFRAAQEIGLHRKSSGRLGLSPQHEEQRRRTFWSAYVLDRMISIQLGRPFLFHDEDIDIQIPLNIDDNLSVEEVIARLQESADIADNNDANVDYASDVTTMSAFLHSLELSRIRTKIHDATYRVNQLGARAQSSVTIDAILEDLNRWRSRHPLAKNPGDCPVQLPEDHWEMEYHHSVQTLLRPLSTTSLPNDRYASLCAGSAGGLCRNQWKQVQRDPRNLSISALYRLFLSGLTLIYLGLNHSSPTTVTPTILADVESCLQSLNVFVNQLPWATAYRDCFSLLKDRFETRMAWQSFAAPTNGPESSGVPPSEGQQRAATEPNDSTNQQWGIDGTGGQPIGFTVGQDYPTFGGADDLEFEALLRSVGMDLEVQDMWNPQGPFSGSMDMNFGLT